MSKPLPDAPVTVPLAWLHDESQPEPECDHRNQLRASFATGGYRETRAGIEYVSCGLVELHDRTHALMVPAAVIDALTTAAPAPFATFEVAAAR